MFSNKKYECCYCNFFCKYKSDWSRHVSSQKHSKNMSDSQHNLKKNGKEEKINVFQKKTSNYAVARKIKEGICDTTCSDKKTLVKINVMEPNNEKNSKYICFYCNKKFNSYNSLWYHKNKYKCIKKENQNNEEQEMVIQEQPATNNELIKNLLIQNSELRNFCIEQTQEMKNLMMELSKTNVITNNNIINTFNGNIQNNIQNNHFNIHLFLNEKCKDAINFADFIENVQISNIDIENNASLGFVNGMSKILLDNLKQMSIYERPIHCTDIKRETIYIKDEDKWEKENDDMKKLKNAFQEITRKNMLQINEWKLENPEYEDLDSENGLKYISMMKESIAGFNRDIYHEKIIKNIVKEITIDKIKHKITDS